LITTTETEDFVPLFLLLPWMFEKCDSFDTSVSLPVPRLKIKDRRNCFCFICDTRRIWWW